LLSNTLAMLGREKNPRVALSLITRIVATDFETRSDEHKLALIGALADVADDETVPALEQLLNRGGWFARRTPERTAAARTLARIGTESALRVLEEGSRSRAEAVRAACQEALQSKVAP
jgi:HEAT repeat protein